MSGSNQVIPYRPCPNCDAQSTRLVLEWRDFHEDARWADMNPDMVLKIGRCTECGMVYATNSNEVDMSNTEYVHHEPMREPKPVTGRRLDYHRAQIAMLSDHVKTGASVLDYGSGYCNFLSAAREFGFHVEGLNPNLYAADWSMRVLGIKVHAEMGVDFETDKRYDLVVSDQTFEHLVNPKEDLRKIAEILIDDGIAYIEVPNWHTIKRLRGGVDHLKDPMHYNYFSPETLADIARRVGFRVISNAPAVGRTAATRLFKSVVNPLGIGACSVLLEV